MTGEEISNFGQNCQFLDQQRRQNSPIKAKFDVKEHTTGSFLRVKFPPDRGIGVGLIEFEIRSDFWFLASQWRRGAPTSVKYGADEPIIDLLFHIRIHFSD